MIEANPRIPQAARGKTLNAAQRLFLWLIGNTLAPLLLLLLSNSALSHDIDVTGVARLFLDEMPDNNYRLSVVDQQVPPLFNLQYSLPQQCTAQPPSRYSYRFSCEQALSVQDSFTFPWRLEGIVIVASWLEGEDSSGYFPGDGNFIDVPVADLTHGASSWASLSRRYLVLGVEHILFGIDHLLFVLGLLLVVSGFWTLLKTITAFTVAHSITLAFATLDLIVLPSGPVEAVIALSIVLLAREVIMGQQGKFSLVHHKPWAIALVFGLIHGFGFAGALGELGLREPDIPLALLFFNIGVELGQVAFIMVAALLGLIIARLSAQLMPKLQTILAYSLGGVATYWFIERLSPVLPMLTS